MDTVLSERRVKELLEQLNEEQLDFFSSGFSVVSSCLEFIYLVIYGKLIL